MTTTSSFKVWTSKEEEELLSEYKELSLDDIAVKHNRSKRAIEIRLQDLAVRMLNDNKTEEEILESTGVNKDLLLKRKEAKEKEKERKEQKMSNISDNDNKSSSSNENSQDTINELRLEVKELRLEIKEMRLLFKELQCNLQEFIKK